MEFLLIGGLIALFIGGTQVAKQYNEFDVFRKSYRFEWTIKNLKIGLSRSSFDFNLSVLNPTKSTIRIDKPYIKVFYKGQEISSSKYGTIEFIELLPQQVNLFPFPFTVATLDYKYVDLVKELYQSKSTDSLFKFFDIQIVGYYDGVVFTIKKSMA